MRKAVSLLLLSAFVILILPIRHFAAVGTGGSGALAGHVYDEDMRTPVRNAVVMLRNLITQKEYSSGPTDPAGMYIIPEIEEGRYVMGIKAPSGSYNFHYSLLIKSDSVAKLSVAMKPGNDPVMLREGLDQGKNKSIGAFFKSPAGILSLITAVEVTVFSLFLVENETSPVIR